MFPGIEYIKTSLMHQHHPLIKQQYHMLQPSEIQDDQRLKKVIFSKLFEITGNSTSASTSSSTPLPSISAESSSPSSSVIASLSTKDSLKWVNSLPYSVMIFFNTAAKAESFAKELSSSFRSSSTSSSPTSSSPTSSSLSVPPFIEMHSLLKKEEKNANLALFQQQKVKLMICTDSCARGLDLPFVKIVIQGEFALNVVQHLHRIGRASRAGKEGIALNFYSSAQEDLVNSIMGKTSLNMKIQGNETDPVSDRTKILKDEDGLESEQTAVPEEKPIINEDKRSSIEKSFSRNRGFRAKLKKLRNPSTNSADIVKSVNDEV
jgi:superfamily II DNA/RNA helicase